MIKEKRARERFGGGTKPKGSRWWGENVKKTTTGVAGEGVQIFGIRIGERSFSWLGRNRTGLPRKRGNKKSRKLDKERRAMRVLLLNEKERKETSESGCTLNPWLP